MHLAIGIEDLHRLGWSQLGKLQADLAEKYAELGLAYNKQYRRLGEFADLDKAIESHTRALALTPDGHTDMSSRHASLGVSYTDRYQRLGELADLDKAIESHTRALALTPSGHPQLPRQYLNYALPLLLQYTHTGHLASLTGSLQYFRKAAHHFSGAPRIRFQCSLGWAKLAAKLSLLKPIEAFQAAIDLLPQFIWLGATTNQRYQDLLLTENLAVKACFAAIRSSNYSLALEWLEHARCVVWNQSLMLRSPLDQLHSSYPDLAAQLQFVAKQLDSSNTDSQLIQATSSDLNAAEQAGQQRRHLAMKYNSLLDQIRQLPGLETFLKPAQASTLMHGVRSGPVVVIDCHTDQCDALVILPGQAQITHLPLPDFTEDKARKTRFELEVSLRRKGLRQRGVWVKPPPGYEDGIESVLRILWDDVVKPVLDHLGYIVCITSSLQYDCSNYPCRLTCQSSACRI
ncbi:hypothetical protein ACGC1H_004135 [Rhizoctonia solani]